MHGIHAGHARHTGIHAALRAIPHDRPTAEHTTATHDEDQPETAYHPVRDRIPRRDLARLFA
jgi:hypothetical protein